MIEAKWKREVSENRRKALREAMENPSSGLRLLGGYPLPPFSEHFLLTINLADLWAILGLRKERRPCAEDEK